MYNYHQLTQPTGNGRCFGAITVCVHKVFILNVTRRIDIVDISSFNTAEAFIYHVQYSFVADSWIVLDALWD